MKQTTRDSFNIDLSNLQWNVCGWRPFAWYLRTSMEIGIHLNCDITPVPAQVPGSVQSALLKAGLIKDWNVGLNSLDCEWVEHRHWEFFADLEAGQVPADQPVVLTAEGLDYSGWILVDNYIAATFEGALLRHRFDLTPYLSDGKPHRLSIIFDQAPQEQGQIGFTSKTRYFKPRYNYSWDWCPRMVPIGISDKLSLELGERPVELLKLSPWVGDDGSTGVLDFHLDVSAGVASCVIKVSREGREVMTATPELKVGENYVSVEVPDVKRWWPNQAGSQHLYSVEIEVRESAAISARVGFKTVRWLPCQDAPEGALPWICEVNGQSVFLSGVNWTPLQMDYHSTTLEDYRRILALYRDMGCNVLRVWGGAGLEKKEFYDLCDEMGLMVWQEFPLSSSGPENWPPEDPEVISELVKIARDYVRRRCHHASKLMWCGGNELQHEEGKKTGTGVPVTEAHPCMAALAKVVAEEDPDARFVASSSSGPRFMAVEDDFGKGLHHDVHGPWSLESDMDGWKKYWSNDDALLRSETGMPAAASVEMLEKYSGTYDLWPPTEANAYWRHTGGWWMQWKQFQDQLEGLSGAKGIARYVELSQDAQAEALAVAARCCRTRFPACGGILFWMGHDAFPCAANTSIIDFDRNPKPAYFTIQREFLKQGEESEKSSS